MGSKPRLNPPKKPGGTIERLWATYQYLFGRQPTPTVSTEVGRNVRDTLATDKIRQQMVADGILAAEKGLTVGGLSEASLRLSPEKLLVTKAGSWFTQLSDDDLIIASLDPYWAIDGQQTPKHWSWHRAIYESFPDVGAVFFGQPTEATTMAAMADLPDQKLLIDASETVGGIAHARPEKTTIVEKATSSSVILISGYGVLAYGSNLQHAILRTEIVNRWCEIAIMARIASA